VTDGAVMTLRSATGIAGAVHNGDDANLAAAN
jgi:hypothetical protein